MGDYTMPYKQTTHHAHAAALSDIEQRVKDLEQLLVDKGLVDPAALDEIIDT